jgi:O-antigen/teichoic acid export membrane protein
VSIGDSDFGVQVGVGFLGRVATALVALAGSIFLARVLGPAGYGGFYLIMAVVKFLDNPVTGWSSACRKRLTEADFPSDEALGSLVLAVVIGSALVAGVAFAIRGQVASLAGIENAWVLVSVLFFGVVAYGTSLEMLKATANFGISTWTIAIRDVVRVLIQAGLVIAGLGVAGMVGGMLVANLLLVPVLGYLVGVVPSLPSRETLSSIWAFARSSIPNGVVSTAQDRMDVLLLGVLATQSVVGNYEVALRLTTPAIFISGVAGSGLLGRISNRRSRSESVRTDVRNNISYASLIAIPVFFGTLVVGGPVVVTVYSSQYARAGTLIAGLALYHLFVSQKDIHVAVLDGFDRPELNLRVSLAVFALNVVLGVGLFLTFGPIGVVAATVISAAVGYLARAHLVRQLLPKLSVLPRPLLEQVGSGLIMAGSVLVVRETLALGRWQNVALAVGVGIVVYWAVLLAVSEQVRGTALAVAADAGVNLRGRP